MKNYRRPKPDLGDYAPPGLDWRKEVRDYWSSLFCASGGGFLWYLFWYAVERSDLYWRKGAGEQLLKPGAVMVDFYLLMRLVLLGFVVLGIHTALQVFVHYRYHSQGSKSIYLMKRLPDRMELHRRCLILPAAGLVICVLTAFLTIVLCYGIYMYFTPKECLSPNQWEMFWRLYP